MFSLYEMVRLRECSLVNAFVDRPFIGFEGVHFLPLLSGQVLFEQPLLDDQVLAGCLPCEAFSASATVWTWGLPRP